MKENCLKATNEELMNKIRNNGKESCKRDLIMIIISCREYWVQVQYQIYMSNYGKINTRGRNLFGIERGCCRSCQRADFCCHIFLQSENDNIYKKRDADEVKVKNEKSPKMIAVLWRSFFLLW